MECSGLYYASLILEEGSPRIKWGQYSPFRRIRRNSSSRCRCLRAEMKKASKVLLIIEAVAIASLSIEGILIVLSVIFSFASGSPGKGRFSLIEFLAGIIAICALISGWRIFAWVITNGPSKGIYISPVWWVFAALGASLTILSLNSVQEVLGLPVQPPSLVLSLFQIGAFFLIPFTHLIIEAIWQRRIYTTLQPTDFVGG